MGSRYKYNIFRTALPVCLASLHCWLNPNDYKSIKSLSYLRKLRQFSLTIDPNLLFLLKYSVFFRLVKNNDYMIVGANFLCMCFWKDFFINKISKFSLYIILYMKWNRSLWLSMCQGLDFFFIQRYILIWILHSTFSQLYKKKVLD